jgi:hypothetical protein
VPDVEVRGSVKAAGDNGARGGARGVVVRTATFRGFLLFKDFSAGRNAFLPKKQNKAFKLISQKRSDEAGGGGARRGGAGRGGAGRGGAGRCGEER